MSEPPTPELEAFAARLFAAGRTERPGPALGRRLALIDPRLAPQHTPSGVSTTSAARSAARAAPAGVLRSSRLARGVALAALVASLAGVWLVSQLESDAVSISPERVSPRSRSVLPVTTPPVVVSQPAVSALAPVMPEQAVVEALRSSSLPSPASRGRADVAAPPGTATAARTPRRGSKEPERNAVSEPPTPARSAARRAIEPAAAPRVEADETSSVTPSSTRPQRPLTLLGELDLLKRARAALRSGQARDAVELLEAHGRERGGSELVAEATLLRIEALAALGEHTAASDLAARFVRENPHSALSDRAKGFILVGAAQAP